MDERIVSRKNPLMAHIRKLCASRKYRREMGEYVGDGVKLLAEAVRWEMPLSTVVAVDELPLPALPEGVRLVRVPADVMAYISPMESPQGALFVGKIPAQTAEIEADKSYLVLDGLQDVGNVGTILRSADALGADGVILVNGSVDPWNWKTVRASMGASFRLPLWEMDCATLLNVLADRKIPLYATALREDTEEIRAVALRGTAVAIGSEGSGVSQELLDGCYRTVKIPMRPRCESLNAAAAATVVLWEMQA